VANVNGQIFISYRREDGSAWAGRLYDRLQGRFAAEKLFMDVDSLAPGVDFVEALERSVGACDVLIAVIGRRWLSALDEEGNRRLDNPEDFVRVEVATALKRGIRVIPVLVEGAPVPRSRELPDDLKALVRRNALEVSHNRFSADSERLIRAVEEVLEGARVEQQRKREEHERVEAERRQREQKEQLQVERLKFECRQQEEQARLRADRQLRAEQERVEADRSVKAEQERLQGEQREKERLEAQRRECEEQDRPELERRESKARERLEVERQVLRQDEPEVIKRTDADPRAPPSNRTPLKKPWRLLIVVGSGVAVCLLGFGLLFKAPRPHAVPVGESSVSVPTAGPSNSPNPTPLSKAKSPIPLRAPDSLPRIQLKPGVSIRESPLFTKPSVSLLATPTPAPSNSPSPTPSGADQFAEAKRYLNAKDYAKALPPLQEAADAGSAAAMYNLGGLYEYGLGVAQDYAQARRWYQKAAEAGSADAREALAQLSSASVTPSPTISVASSEPQDDVKTQAYDSYLKAAKAGNAEAMCRLGWVYQSGWGVGQDYAKARDWYQRAAKARNAEAMYRLGQIYENGWGVDQDYAKARGWYQKAVDAGGDLANDAEQALSRLHSQFMY
jgi:hypothetical protein